GSRPAGTARGSPAAARNPRFAESTITMIGRYLTAVAAIAAVVTHAVDAESSGSQAMAQVLMGFYQVHQKSAQDGVPDAKLRAKYGRYISPGLNKLLADSDAAEARYAKANPDSPPMMEGDL